MARNFLRGLLVGIAAGGSVAFVIALTWPHLRVLVVYKPSLRFATVRRIEKLHRSCYIYKTNKGRFPSGSRWQEELIGAFHPGYSGSGIIYFVDAWGNAMKYRIPGTLNKGSFDVYSIGPNGIDEGGGGDDLGNWDASWPPYRGVWRQIANSYEGEAK